MAKRNYLKRNESLISKLLMAAFLFLMFTLVLPMIGYTATSPAWYVSLVDFFTDVKLHISGFWMFYTLGGALLYTSLKKAK